MRYHRFGKTNLLLSVFSFGTMRSLASQGIFQQTLEYALERGINHIETAQGYGKSEEYLGNLFQSGLPIDREKLYITTKIPPTPDHNKMTQNINQSLKKLKLDYVDCLAIHGINTPEHLAWIESDQGCWKAIEDAKQQGKVRSIGFSTHGSLEIIKASINTHLFDFVNLHYYYFFQRHQEAIDLAKKKDMGVFIISPADKGGRLYTPPETLKKLCRPFTPLEINYRFLLSDHRITTLSIGPANPEELIEPLKVADNDHPLTPEEMNIFQNLETHLSEKVGLDLCHQCYQCLPCPEDINIPEVLRLRNLAVGYDMQDFGEYRYRMFENAGHWFPGHKANKCTNCGECLPRCPQELDIPQLLFDTHERLNGPERRRLWENE